MISEVARETSACRICGGRQWIDWIVAPDYRSKQGGSYQYTRCQQCGVGVIEPLPTPEAISAFYQDDYYSYSGSLNVFYKVRLLIYRLLSWLNIGFQDGVSGWSTIGGYPRGNVQFLDFGCGAGTVLRIVGSDKVEACGVEFSELAVARGKTNSLKMFCSLEELETGSFDIVRAWHVFEHLDDPLRYLRGINRVLKDGGVLALAVPSSDSWLLRVFHEHWSSLDAPRHLYLFNQRSLCFLLEKAGYQIVKSKLYNSGSLSSSVYLYLSGRYGLKLNFLLSNMCIALLTVVEMITRGHDSCFIIAKKNKHDTSIN
ncbi:MAG: class I SAM-dependent methyltransferase [bacterium]